MQSRFVLCVDKVQVKRETKRLGRLLGFYMLGLAKCAHPVHEQMM